MAIILGANSAADAAYDVANSCRFNDGDAPKLNKSFGTATSRRKWTLSMWVKRGIITHQMLMTTASATAVVKFNASHQFQVTDDTGLSYITNRLFRDVGAWYHIVVAVDTEQGTAGNRQKIYINGTQETSFATSTAADEDDDTNINSAVDHKFASYDGSTDFAFDGYMAEIVFIDGLQLAATSFGEFDEDSPTIWKPIDVSGLTFGTNGFYLDFEASDNLGNDANGGTDWTETNLAAVDQATDTPTNNYATMNPLDNYYAGSTFSEGNLDVLHGSSAWTFNTSTIKVPKSGKWYAEFEVVTAQSNIVGISREVSLGAGVPLEHASYSWAYRNNGNVYNNNSDLGGTYSAIDTAGQIIGVYIDQDNSKLYFGHNGTIQNSGTGISITADTEYFFAIGDNTDGARGKWSANFGNPSGSFAIASGNTDANDYGNFEYDPSDGGSSSFDSAAKDFYALNTKNLAEFG